MSQIRVSIKPRLLYGSIGLLLAGVLTSTTLFWLNDKSDGHAATWAFLERRIDEVLKIGGRLGKTVTRVLDFPDRLMARCAPGGFARR